MNEQKGAHMKKNINTGWIFTKDATLVQDNRTIAGGIALDLPHTWNGADGQDGGDDYYRGTCYYAKKLSASEFPEKLAYLEFCGVNAIADVYANGEQLGHHEGGYQIFRINLTDCLAKHPSEEIDILVAVNNAKNDYIYPQYADFTFYGGIYRDVNIISVPEAHFELDYLGTPGIKVTPKKEEEGWKVETEVFLANAKADHTLTFTVKDAAGQVVASTEQSAQNTKAVLSLGDAHLWNGLKDPYLYSVTVQLCCNGKCLDERSCRFGCRTFHVDPELGFFLNGESYPLRGVAKHQDRPSKGNALSREDHKEDLELIREVGANTIRLSHYQYDQYVYDLCDEMGFVLWSEIPYISVHMPNGRQSTISQLKELIVQCYNHPSIFVWGMSNEITMQGANDPDLIENHRILNQLAHDMDPTRLTTMAVISGCPLVPESEDYLSVTDVQSWNHYFGWYGGTLETYGPWFDAYHKAHPDRPVGLSEYGCEAFKWHTAKPGAGDYSEEYQSMYHEALIPQIDARPYLWATHVWNMFDFAADSRDEGGEAGMNHKGLVTFDRKYKKDSFYAYKAWLSEDPFVHICSRNYVDRIEDETMINVYSNQPEVELFVNGESVGKKQGKWFFKFYIPNVGEQTITARAGKDGELTDQIFIRKVTEPNMDYVMQIEGAVVLNWFDIDEPEGFYSINDTLGDLKHVPQVAGMIGKIMANANGGSGEQKNELAAKMDPKAIEKILNGFTLKRMLVMAKGMTKEQIIGINKMLNQIPKH